MPPRKMNPITEKLWKMIHSGKTTKEKICVASDLKYPTLENVFTRPQISYATMKSLRFAGVISAKDEDEYRRWVLDNDPKNKKRETNANTTVDNIDQHEEPIEDLEGDSESEEINP